MVFTKQGSVSQLRNNLNCSTWESCFRLHHGPSVSVESGSMSLRFSNMEHTMVCNVCGNSKLSQSPSTCAVLLLNYV